MPVTLIQRIQNPLVNLWAPALHAHAQTHTYIKSAVKITAATQDCHPDRRTERVSDILEKDLAFSVVSASVGKGFYCVALAGPRLPLQPRVASNS